MRNRVSSRIITLGCLVALLWLLPSTTNVAQARPIGPGWNPYPPPPTTTGDTDGVVLAKSFVRGTTVATGTEKGTTNVAQSRYDLWSSVLVVYRHGGLRGILVVLRLPDGWLGLL
jgi:hypothetical protein